MYDAYWGLNRRPFDATDESEFYYPAQSHQIALLKLRYAIEQRAGAGLLVGEAGVGKTLLARLLQNQLSDDHQPIAHVAFPPPDFGDLIRGVTDQIAGRGDADETLDRTSARLEAALREAADEERRPLLVIDEAQVIERPADLDRLRMLFSFQRCGAPLLGLVLVAQPRFLSSLQLAPQLEPHFTAKCVVQPFGLDETISYVQHRLAAAGSDRPIFTDRALELIHRHADGAARRINRLCDLSMLIGYADELSAIDADQILAVVNELSFAA
ncbi:MAG: AAA family ATPase [Pirellulaceae bacterium]|jgi:general secretion pathway protein A|nr:AAA family ATPase [Pirellulaceae bacterium]MDP7016088.1 AAA family ATPase [Pirellulaceae bacterium]